MPDQKDLLAHSNQINRKLQAEAMPERKTDAPVLAVPPAAKDLKMTDDNEDPFNGNMNNRRVAERIANTPGKRKQFLNNSMPTHIGDPNKAAADVAKSQKVNPVKPEDDPDKMPPLTLPSIAQHPAPDSGQTAAQALESVKAKGGATATNKPPAPASGAAPAWKPNA